MLGTVLSALHNPSNIIFFVFWMRNLRHREGKSATQGHRGREEAEVRYEDERLGPSSCAVLTLRQCYCHISGTQNSALPCAYVGRDLAGCIHFTHWVGVG